MKIGDMIAMAPCPEWVDGDDPEDTVSVQCSCFFCHFGSSRIGVIVEEIKGGWSVMFDCGEWPVGPYDLEAGDAKVINATR